jgi:hypothetical protein
MCQNVKDVNREIKNVKQDLMLNEYPQHFIDCAVKPRRSNCPSGGTYHGMVITPYVWGVSEKSQCIGDHFNVSRIFRTKYSLCGTMMKTEPVRYAQQTKQCVHSIACDWQMLHQQNM